MTDLTQNNPFQELRINLGERPNWESRINYPKLFNLFIGDDQHVYTDPGLSKLSQTAPDTNTRGMEYSQYRGGSYFCVTDTFILQIRPDGSFKEIAMIDNTGLAVQIDENDNDQVIVVDGRKAYVYSQKTNVFTILGASNGFSLTTPISVVVLNNIGIVLDKATNAWYISDPNNLLTWNPLNFVYVDSSLTQGLSLETLNNNLYIFGSTGIERWVPNTGNNPYLFPFDKDTNYRQDFGAISTNGVERGFNVIYFLSSKYVPMALSVQGIEELVDNDYKTGLARILSSYPDVEKCEASFFAFKGNYIFSMTFVNSGVCWRLCINSKTYSRGDDLIISAVRTYPIVATPGGIFNLTLAPQENKMRLWVGEKIQVYKGVQPSRMTLSGFDVQLLQGLVHQGVEQLELSFSMDGQQTWTNTVNRPLGNTGQRNAQTTWAFNMTGKEFTPKIAYYGSLELTITRIATIVK